MSGGPAGAAVDELEVEKGFGVRGGGVVWGDSWGGVEDAEGAA